MAGSLRIKKPATNGDRLPQFDGYEMVRRLGYGAASTIYAVRRDATGEMYVLKQVIRGEGEDARMIQQVENEYEVGARVSHPYVRKVHEIFRRKRHLKTREVYLLMEYCPGVSLEQSPSRSLLDILLIFRMVADALGGMHSQGYLHCDMKPNNIIIADNGAIRIIDLGQSCAIGTVKPRIQGTPDYIAPEQVKRKPLTPRTDVFNLGATMYWCMTGKHVPTLLPKQGNRIELAVQSVGVEGFPSPHQLRPKVPVGVSNLIMECCRRDPRERPADMPSLIARFDLLIHLIAGKRFMIGRSGPEDLAAGAESVPGEEGGELPEGLADIELDMGSEGTTQAGFELEDEESPDTDDKSFPPHDA